MDKLQSIPEMCKKAKEFEIKIPQELSAKLIEDLCEHSNMTWNKKHCRAEIDNIEPCKYLQDFNIRSLPVHDVNTIFGNFKQGIMRNLPIMPKFKIIASEWQEQWLNKLFIDDHVSPESMEYLQRAWLKHSAINHFDLPLLLGQELLRKLDGEKRINEVYWHAAASNYLMPKLTKMTLPSITFTDKQAISTEELLRALTLNSEINSIIYSDRHYKSKLHANNLCAIHNQCNPNVGVVFTTDPDVNVPTGWEKELVKNSRDNHDRYYIFIANTEIFTWKCSTSLDFANLSKEQSFTKGNCTFTRLRESELPLYLQDCLRKINEEVAA
ncbi:hypothetical protein [Psychromonas sp. KJ10-2]|uniref:hypothetical protein n=1 Tax=Psychromonas sp. KJ10-2 TaxID=3391822 RepID=UPI0039B3F8A1